MSKRERLVSLARVISKTSPGVSARPTWVSMRVACAAILSPFLSVPSFHLDRAREQDVVLQVNVLMDDGLLHPHDVGEQNHLFLHHVGSEFLSESPKAGADMLQLRMILAVHRTNLVEQRAQPGDLLARVLVVRLVDVIDQISQWFCLPVAVLLLCPGRLLCHLE